MSIPLIGTTARSKARVSTFSRPAVKRKYYNNLENNKAELKTSGFTGVSIRLEIRTYQLRLPPLRQPIMKTPSSI